MPTIDEESVHLMIPQHSQENGRSVSYGLSPHQQHTGGINFQTDELGLSRFVCAYVDSNPCLHYLLIF